MAKGDAGRAQNQINNQGTTAQDSQNATMNQIYGQNLGFQNNYNTGVAQNLNDYSGIMGNYQGLINGLSNGQFGGGGRAGLSTSADSKYFQNFADTGGLGTQDIQDLRTRAISPTRAVYANAQRNLDTNKSQQQFSPNYAAATAKMARDLSYGISDANTNANAGIAGLIQSGKLAGAQGLQSNNQFNAGQGNQNSQFNAGLDSQNRGQTLSAMLGAMGGQSNLYGTTPGLSATFSNQLLNSSNQLLQGNQNQTGLSGGLVNGQLGKSQIPGDFSQAVGNVTSVLKPVAGLLSGGITDMIPSSGQRKTNNGPDMSQVSTSGNW